MSSDRVNIARSVHFTPSAISAGDSPRLQLGSWQGGTALMRASGKAADPPLGHLRRLICLVFIYELLRGRPRGSFCSPGQAGQSEQRSAERWPAHTWNLNGY